MSTAFDPVKRGSAAVIARPGGLVTAPLRARVNGWRCTGAQVLLAGLVLGWTGTVQAMTALSESEMSSVSGKDGVRLDFDAGGAGQAISAEEVRWTNDPGTAEQGAFSMRGVELEAPGTFPMGVDIDAGSDGTSPFASVVAEWDELGLTVDNLTLRNSSGNLVGSSGGEIGFFSSGGLTVVNESGLFNAGSTDAYFDLSFSTDAEPGDFILRHGPAGSPEFSFGNANLSLETLNCDTNDCTLGINQTDGLFLAADLVNLDLNFDLLFKNNPTNFDRGNPSDPLDIGGRDELIKFGWTGGLEQFNFSVNAASVAGTQGLQFDTEFDYADDFSLILGQAGIENPRAVFKAFEPLGTPSGREFSLPLTLDVVPGGTNMGDLCFGNTAGAGCSGPGEEPISLTTDGRYSLAGRIRAGHMRSYNTEVDVVDRTASGDPDVLDGAPGDPDENSDGDDFENYNWSLGYTFGELDLNAALYPGIDNNLDDGTVSLDSEGITTDVALSIDSPGHWAKLQNGDPTAGDNWATNTHFFIADTDTAVDVNGSGTAGDEYAFGLLNADLIWQADNLGIRVAADSDTAFGIDFPGGLWLQSDQNARYQFRGFLGGGDLNDLSTPTPIAITNVRLDTDNFFFALSPTTGAGGQPAIGFDGLLDLNADTFISLAEPSQPSADMRIGSLSGRIRWQDGAVELRSSAENSPGLDGEVRPSLTLSNDLLIGQTAGGDPLTGNINVGNDQLGQAAIPTGQFYSSISLKPQ